METSDPKPITRTITPIVTGTSILGVKYHDGIMLCADTQASYGTSRKFKGFSRIARINDKAALTCTGEMSDFQAIVEFFREKDLADSIQEDGVRFYSAKDYATYLSEWTYYRRRKVDPLMNVSLVGGFDGKGNKYLGYIDQYGTLLEGDYLVAGLAHYFCKVLLASYAKPDMTEAQARGVLEECMRVLFYKDARASEQIQFCTITPKGVTIEKPIEIKSNWVHKQFIENTNEKIRSVMTT